jgi:hypothetical protein
MLPQTCARSAASEKCTSNNIHYRAYNKHIDRPDVLSAGNRHLVLTLRRSFFGWCLVGFAVFWRELECCEARAERREREAVNRGDGAVLS